ncbi:GNAT family N-acetyltransferase [candidate division KSB1 bacterium]|nr:GNAT family N-acetyltransferase [candidate division KSB1 bacterium]
MRLETERLALRPYRDDDIDALLRCRGDESVARYQLWEPFTREDAEKFIGACKAIPPGAPGTWSGLAVELKSTGQLIGDCALRVDENGRTGEIGFNLTPEFQGFGYGTEAVRRLLEYAFRDLHLLTITAVMDADNRGAINLCQRLGMRREKLRRGVQYKGRLGDEMVYVINREEF